MVEILNLLNKIVELIPKIIASIKDFAINTLHFSAATYSLIVFALALIGAFYFLKQFIVSGWAKVRTIVNWLLLALIFYLILNPQVIQ